MSFDWATGASIASAMATSVGILFIWHQIRLAARTAKATFVFQLECQFAEQHKDTFHLIETIEDPLLDDKQADVELYLDFFGTLESFRQHKFLSLQEIDQLFAYRFFSVLSRPAVIDLINEKRPYWQSLIQLGLDWYRYRETRLQPIQGDGPELQKFLGIRDPKSAGSLR